MSRVKYKRYLTQDQSEFDHRWACWANNHNGWAKAKRLNKRLAKRKLNRILDKEQEHGICNME